MKTRILAIMLAALGVSRASAFEWAPDARDIKTLVGDLRGEAARPGGAVPEVISAPVGFGQVCHTVVTALSYAITVDADGAVVGVDGPDKKFARAMNPKRIDAGLADLAYVDAHGGEWVEPLLAKIVRQGGRGKTPVSRLEPRHAGYFLSWSETTPQGCRGSFSAMPIQDVLGLEQARNLVEREEFARKNKGTQPTAKPRNDPPSA